MIETLRVQGFKSLRDTSLTLRPFTVLIGPNDSGKSSVLDAIRFLGRTQAEALKELGAQSLQELSWMGTAGHLQWQVSGSADGAPYVYELNWRASDGVVVGESLTVRERKVIFLDQGLAKLFNADGARVGLQHEVPILPLGTVNEPRLLSVRRALRSSQRYHLDATALREPQPIMEAPTLSSRGHNLALVLDRILGEDRAAFEAIEATLRELVPSLQGLALHTVRIDANTHAKTLDFVLKDNGSKVRIPAAQASEGALLLTAFLALVYGDTPEILLVEEPENGLHPRRLKAVLQLFRDISTGKVGNRPRQVIVTTHNPILLNEVQPEEVRVVTRTLEGGTTVKNFDELPDIRRHLEEFGVGELWYLIGEEGLLKGAAP